MSDRPSHFREPATTIQRGDIAAMYRSRASDPLYSMLGHLYQPPATFEHGRETLVTEIVTEGAPECGSHLFETRTPVARYVVETNEWRITTFNPRLASEFMLESSVGEIEILERDPIASRAAGA